LEAETEGTETTETEVAVMIETVTAVMGKTMAMIETMTAVTAETAAAVMTMTAVTIEMVVTIEMAVTIETVVVVYRRGHWFVSSVSEIRIMQNITSPGHLNNDCPWSSV
jgi:hypothetical protein